MFVGWGHSLDLEETYTAACALGLHIILHPWIATVRIWLQPQAGGISTGEEIRILGSSYSKTWLLYLTSSRINCNSLSDITPYVNKHVGNKEHR